VHVHVGTLDATAQLAPKATEHTFRAQKLPTGEQKLEAWADADGRRVGVRFVEITAQP